MEKVTQLKKQLRKYLQDWVDYHPDEQTGVPLSVVESESDGHFFLLEYGQGVEGWVHFLMVHLQVTDMGTIVLLQNNTDIEPLTELEEYGVMSKDLTIGWTTEKKVGTEQQQAA